MNLEEAIKYALDGDAILFLGSGFSIGGTNKLKQPFVTATDLSYQMCDSLGIARSGELAIISERFISDKKVGKGIKQFLSFLRDRMICTSTSDTQNAIASIPWIRIYTTNYDNIMEVSSKKLPIERPVITATLPKYSLKNIDGAIVHLNGNIINVTPEKFYEEFKITNKNYLNDGFLDSDWGSQFTHDINSCKAIIFIGYSMKYDLELQKVMHEKINDKAVFIDQPTIDENQAFLLEQWGSLYNKGTELFSTTLSKIKQTYKPNKKIPQLKSFQEIKINDYIEKKISSNDVITLLTFGHYNKFWFRSSDSFFIERKEHLDNIIKLLDKHRICVIHSNFGNGKSIFIDYIASQLVEENNIFYLENDSNIQEDLRLITQRETANNILIIDNYDQHMNFFKEFSLTSYNNIKVITTCRSSISDLLLDRLENDYNINSKEIAIENIEILSKDERDGLIKLFDSYELWGKYATNSPSQKNKLINDQYHNRLSHIFYMLLDSKVIESKMNIIFKSLQNESLKKYIFAQSICYICNFKLKSYELARLIHIPLSSIEKLSLSRDFKEIFLNTGSDIELRSSVFSQYIVRELKEFDLLSSIAQKIYINTQYSGNNDYYTVRKKLVSRSNLIEIFGGKNGSVNWRQRDNFIYKYYDSIREYSKSNPFFWLQFAITALNLNRYPDANLYLQNAYAYAESLEKFDCFQLDTHYARFLLAEMISCDAKFDYDKFIKAHNLLMDNSNAEIRLAYVLRQVDAYYDLDKKFNCFFTPGERISFINSLKEIVTRFENYFSAIERKKGEVFYFAIEKSVRKSYKTFRKLLINTIPNSELILLDNRYNKLVKNSDKIRPGKL